jgi:hypothetical protein
MVREHADATMTLAIESVSEGPAGRLAPYVAPSSSTQVDAAAPRPLDATWVAKLGGACWECGVPARA